MDEIQESKDKVVNELMQIRRRLDRIHSWLAAFIVFSVIMYLIFLVLIFRF